jgi:thiamine biosynthesis lipoprotein ApbE
LAQAAADGRFEPKAEVTRPKQALVSVSAPLAAAAGGLSTDCCLLDPRMAYYAVASFAGAALELII